MPKLGKDQRVTIKVLHQCGTKPAEIARTLKVDESTIRYHIQRNALQRPDGRAKVSRIDSLGLGNAVRDWWAKQKEILPPHRSPNVLRLHEWLADVKDYDASVKSVRVWVRKHLERRKIRPYRRVETPPGAQAQVDWSEYRDVELGDGQGPRTLMVFHMKLSHSRMQIDIPCLGSDQLWWHAAHLEAFRRLGGVPAIVRIDNLKTGISEGSGVWGTVNPHYQAFAKALGFHVDPCPVRHPEAKGKVERGVRTFQFRDVGRYASLGLDALRGWMQQSAETHAQRHRCPATGTLIHDAWVVESNLLRPLPDPCPEPFDIAVTRIVARDCTAAFEGRRYGVPFAYVDFPVEVRGCAGRVQIVDPMIGKVLKVWPRHTKELLLIDQDCYAGESTDRVLAPIPLGALGKRLMELGADGVQRRSIDIYAAVADLVEARS